MVVQISLTVRAELVEARDRAPYRPSTGSGRTEMVV